LLLAREKKMLIKTCAMLAAAGLLVATSVTGAPITYRMSVPNASGVNRLVAFTNQTVVLTVLADTSRIVALADLAGAGPGACVPADSTLISVGGAPTLQAIAPMFFCATQTASIVGVFTSAQPTTATVYFAGNYSNAGITNFMLASDFPLTSNVSGLTKPTSDPLDLAGGGTASIGVVPDEGATFSASLVPTSVPTLGDAGLAALSVLLALAAMMASRQRSPG
jgi:hypothetical protein